MMSKEEIINLVMKLLENFLTKEEFLKYVEQQNRQKYQD
jgi:hypothetical protein